jgi:hypothetical protein
MNNMMGKADGQYIEGIENNSDDEVIDDNEDEVIDDEVIDDNEDEVIDVITYIIIYLYLTLH